MKLRGAGSFTLVGTFLIVLFASRIWLLGRQPGQIDYIYLGAFCLVPCVALSLASAQFERMALYRSQSIQVVALVAGMYLLLSHPEFYQRFFRINSLNECYSEVHVFRVLNGALFLGGVLGASIVLTLGIAEVMFVWIGQVDSKLYSLPHFSGRIVYFTLVMTLLGERISVLFFEKVFASCSM